MQTTRIAEDLLLALRFLSRLPLPALKHEDEPFAAPALSRIAYAIPLAGGVIGLMGGAVLVLAHAVGLPSFLCAALAVTALAMTTGAFHEDGLADTADGLGGGRNRDARLVIMRDSRIGTYGTVALVLSLLLRIGAIQALLDWAGPVSCALVLAAAGAASRAAGIMLLQSLPPAREDGSGASAGVPGPDAAVHSLLVAALVVALVLIPLFGVSATFAGLIAPAIAWFVLHRFARRLLGGQTGDIAGATQQVAEIAFLLGVLIFSKGH